MEAAAEAAMPDTAWEAVEAADGRVYFWNTETDEVTWSLPPALAHLYPGQAAAAARAALPAPIRWLVECGGDAVAAARVAARDCTAAVAGAATRCKETMAARSDDRKALLPTTAARSDDVTEVKPLQTNLPQGRRESFKGHITSPRHLNAADRALPRRVRELFRRFDASGEGLLTLAELQSAAAAEFPQMPEHASAELPALYDTSANTPPTRLQSAPLRQAAYRCSTPTTPAG